MRLNPPIVPSSTSVTTKPADQRQEKEEPGNRWAEQRDVEEDWSRPARLTTPIGQHDEHRNDRRENKAEKPWPLRKLSA